MKQTVRTHAALNVHCPGIIKYMTEQARPAAQAVDSLKTAKRMCSHANDVTVIGFFATDEDSAYENFVAAGEELREEYKNYVYTTDASIIKGLQAQPNTVRVCIPDKWTSKHEPSFREMKIVSRHPLCARTHTYICRRVHIARISYLSYERTVHPWLDIERARI